MKDQNKRRGLKAVAGGHPAGRSLCGVPVAVGAENDPPFQVDAVALEDDTYGVLAADPAFREPDEHPIRIWTEVHEMTPSEPGSVSVGKGQPLRLLAVVHDLAADPSWREEWITRALAEVLGEVGRRGIRGLGLQSLGSVHGRLPVERFFELLQSALERDRPPSLERLWLIVLPGQADALNDLLAKSARP